MGFSISIIKNPIFVWDKRRECRVVNWDENSGDHNLNFDLDYEDFYELQNFLDVHLTRTKQAKNESFLEHHEQLKTEYLKIAKEKGFEMLGRFWYEFDDAVYLSNEVIKLRNECLRIKSISQNPDLTLAVDKILSACDDALKTNSGLFFGCD